MKQNIYIVLTASEDGLDNPFQGIHTRAISKQEAAKHFIQYYEDIEYIDQDDRDYINDLLRANPISIGEINPKMVGQIEFTTYSSLEDLNL